MGSSCSSGQKKKKKESPPLEARRRSSARSVDSLPYGKSSPTLPRGHVAATDTPKKKEVPPPVEIKSIVQSPESKTDATLDSVSTPGSAATVPPLSTTSSTPRTKDTPGSSPLGMFDIKDYPETVRSLLLGRMNDVDEDIKPPIQEITIYICADYKETEAERCALIERIFPLLRESCADKGYELNVIDLHWAVAGDCLDDHSFGNLCLETLRSLKSRGKLIILILLHDNPEPPLLPRQIVDSDFEEVLQEIKSDEDRELFHKWYLRDENAVPASYILQSISEYLPSIASNKQQERQSAMDKWREESRRMILALKEAFSDESRNKYLTPVVEEEIELIIAEQPALVKRTLWLQRKYTQIPEDGLPAFAEESDKELIDNNDRKRLSVLKNRLIELIPDNQRVVFPVKWHPDGTCLLDRNDEDSVQYLDDLCDGAEEILRKMIEGVIEEDVSFEAQQPLLGIERPLYMELVQQYEAYNFHRHRFLGRENLLDTIKEYLLDASTAPLVVHGASGCGKTGLVVKAAELCASWNPDASIVLRLVGVTPESSTSEQLLRSICEQLCVLYGEHPSLASKALLNPKATFTGLISKASSQRPLIVIIDGLDQVARYSSQDFSWLPYRLPEAVKLILTFRDKTTQLERFQELDESNIQFLPVPCLTSDESLHIMKTTLGRQNRDLTDAQWRLVILSLHDSPTPLYSQLLAHMSCQWHSIKGPDELAVKRTVEGLILRIFSSLEGYVGAPVLAFLLGLLVVTKHGLSDGELLDILSCDEVVLDRVFSHGKAGVRRFPYSVWARVKSNLSVLLKTCVVSGRVLTSLQHDIVKDLCFHYLEENSTASCSKALIDYFQGSWAGGRKKPSTNKEGSLDRFVLAQPLVYASCPNHRKLAELPYLCLQDEKDALEQYIFDGEWLYYKFWGCDPLEFLEDIKVYQLHYPGESEELDLLKNVTLLSGYALRYDGTQVFSQFYGRLQNLMADNSYADKFPSIKKLYSQACKPPFSSFLSSPLCLTEPYSNSRHPKDDKSASFTNLFCIRDDNRYVIAVSPDKGEIVVWDVYKHCAVRTLTGAIQPREVKMIDRYRALVLCNRELKVYNLDEGCLVTKLKGVMNQKMAYYGIHGDNYVVALSRNRMYVNMMNLETGDLETTFKVGEDRFLNSLLVSTNGRICVCGDETQKPFPLLVWDLANRKLLYDLRIPHHEFITRLSAISDDGHYVASVCRELHDGSPNFIIVYDLQSGTLFKKWKPESNSCSIAVSSQGGCVIDGLENTLVVIWDLSTGARRFTLRGHTAPVDSIKLAECGTRCLTHNSAGKDLSLRLWDITKGTCLAVFTPDYPICCYELLQDGNAAIAAMKGIPGIVTLVLCQGRSIEECEPPFNDYGDPERRGCASDVSQEG